MIKMFQEFMNSAHLKVCRVVMPLVAIMAYSTEAFAQNSAITDLKKENLTEVSLYFYPSTLRMANLDNNQEFNRLIEDIDKLIFYKMNGKFETIDLYNLVADLQKTENFEEYIVVDGPTKKFYLLGSEDPSETVGLAHLNDTHYVFDIAGSLDFKELPKLYEYLSENDSTLQNKFGQVLDLISIGNNMIEVEVKK